MASFENPSPPPAPFRYISLPKELRLKITGYLTLAISYQSVAQPKDGMYLGSYNIPTAYLLVSRQFTDDVNDHQVGAIITCRLQDQQILRDLMGTVKLALDADRNWLNGGNLQVRENHMRTIFPVINRQPLFPVPSPLDAKYKVAEETLQVPLQHNLKKMRGREGLYGWQATPAEIYYSNLDMKIFLRIFLVRVRRRSLSHQNPLVHIKILVNDDTNIRELLGIYRYIRNAEPEDINPFQFTIVGPPISGPQDKWKRIHDSFKDAGGFKWETVSQEEMALLLE